MLAALLFFVAAPVRAIEEPEQAAIEEAPTESQALAMVNEAYEKAGKLLKEGEVEAAIQVLNDTADKITMFPQATELRLQTLWLLVGRFMATGEGQKATEKLLADLVGQALPEHRDAVCVVAAQVYMMMANYDAARETAQTYLKQYPPPTKEELEAFRKERFTMGDPAEPDPALKHPRILARTALKDLLDRLAFIGKEAPQFELETLDGQKVSPADFKGRILIIDFWATWCQPCVDALPGLKATYEEQHAKGLEILGLSLDEDKDRLAAFVEKEKIPWKQVYLGEKGNELGKLYGFEGSIPAIFLIDRAGMVRGMDLRGQVLKLQVAKLMKQEATPPPPGASIAEPQP